MRSLRLRGFAASRESERAFHPSGERTPGLWTRRCIPTYHAGVQPSRTPKQVNGTMRTLRTTLASGFLVLCAAAPAFGQATQVSGKKPLDHDAYDIWNRITTQAISDNGRYVLYVQSSEANDPRVFVKDAASGATLYELERGDGAQFTEDSRFVVYRLKPSKAAVKEAEKAKKKPDQM